MLHRFTKDFDVPNDRILRLFVREELRVGESRCVCLDAMNGLANVCEVTPGRRA